MVRLVAILFIFAATTARADERRASAAFAAGAAAYADGKYAAAVAAFEEAFRNDPRAETAFTLAQAHRNQYFVDHEASHLHRALGLYRHYLLEVPRGRRAAHARLHLESIEAVLASLGPAEPLAPRTTPTQLLITSNARGAVASIDGDAGHAVPRLAEVAPGAHRVAVSAPGHGPVTIDALAIAERLVVVPANQRARPARITVRTRGHVTIDATPTASGEAVVAPGPHVVAVMQRGHVPQLRLVDVDAGGALTIDVALRPTVQRRAARITLASAVVLAGIATFSGGMAWLAQADAVERVPATPADIDAYNAALDRRDTWRTVATGFALAGAAAAVTGAGLWWFDSSPRPAAPRMQPSLGPESIGVAIAGGF